MLRYRLLVVDDDAVDRRVLVKLLAELGTDSCHIQEANDGATGVAAMQAEPFDCVLLDFNLPDMNGLEFLDAAADTRSACAVVLVTGHGNEAIAVEAMKRGAQDYLVKDQVNATNLWRAVTQAVTQLELKGRLAGSLRELTAANLALEQEVITRKAAEAGLRAARDAAEDANRAKTRFVAMVTHELRTPLNGILGYAQLLRIEGGLSSRQDEHVGAMTLAGRHLFEMIESVLDFASIESGRMELHPVEVSLRDLTEECIAFTSPMATERGLELRLVQSHDVPSRIFTDPARLRQVMLNLLGNALKFTDAGSVELRLSAGSSAGGLRVEISDTGRGISEANRERLFQEFERLDAATSVEGAGLGLSIAARIVRLMGGTINYRPNLDDAKSNGGSVFWFELPPAEMTSASKPVAVVSSSPSLRVLLVDDIAINRDILGAFLKAAGHVATLAKSGLEAIRLATEQQFDVILMDVRMPEMDGMEAAQRIRALPGGHGRMPILALTAHTFANQEARCREAGMDAHLPKPIAYETLIDAINVALRNAADSPAASATECAIAGAPA